MNVIAAAVYGDPAYSPKATGVTAVKTKSITVTIWAYGKGKGTSLIFFCTVDVDNAKGQVLKDTGQYWRRSTQHTI